MSRLYVFVSLASCMLLSASAYAQDATLPQALVRGLATNDLLNIRADPSALGKTLGRLPNGAFVEQHECKLVEGYEWCRVSAPEFENLLGWAPARYLYPLDVNGAETVDEESEAAPSKNARLSSDQGTETLPDGLEARFAGGSSRPIAEIMTQEEDDSAADAETAPADPGIPVPTPRPDDGTPEPAEDIASATSEPRLETLPTGALPAELTSEEVPCARHVGQPMARCIARVRRISDEAAYVTVEWPDGGTRVIEFRDRLPAGSNSSGEFRFTREGSLNMIRIGISERFEILDALPFDG